MTKIKPVRVCGFVTKQGLVFAMKYIAAGVIIGLIHAVIEVRF